MSVLDENVNIKVFLKEGDSRLIATATVSVSTVDFGYVTIKGFQVWKSENLNGRLQEYINITPPTTMIKGGRIYLIFFEDREKWYGLEERIYDAFRLCKVKGKSKSNLPDNLADDVERGLNDSNLS